MRPLASAASEAIDVLSTANLGRDSGRASTRLLRDGPKHALIRAVRWRFESGFNAGSERPRYFAHWKRLYDPPSSVKPLGQMFRSAGLNN